MHELNEEVAELKMKGLSLEAMKYAADGEFHAYTGFSNYQSFKAVCDYVCLYASTMQHWKGKRAALAVPTSTRGNRKLLPEEEFLAVLIRLRCGFRGRDMAKFFGDLVLTLFLCVQHFDLPVVGCSL